MKIKITIKKLEIFFVIVYLVIAVLCLSFFGTKGFIGSTFGALVGMGDWYIIKFMSIRWLKKGGYSFFENSLRYVIVGFGIWMLFEMKLDILGIIAGLSVVPLSIIIASVIALINKKNISI